MDFKQEYIDFSTNYYVRVRIKEMGYQKMADHYNKWGYNIRPDVFPLKTVEELKARADKQGYTKLQLHTFIEIFGGDGMIGSVVTDYYDIRIKISTTNI